MDNSSIVELLRDIDKIIWGIPILIMRLSTGIFFTIRLKLIQLFRLPLALKLIAKAKNQGVGDISSFKSLCVALSATVAPGNIVGVSMAVSIGGPGALFWMLIATFFSMATKYSEALLAVKYRQIDDKGEVVGGPMTYILNGLGEYCKPMAYFFAISCLIVSFLGLGTFLQVNTIVDTLETSLGIDRIVTDIALTILIAAIIFGGLKSIAKVTKIIVPFMLILYVLISTALIIVNINHLPGALVEIISSAFTGHAAVGGFAGSTIMMAMQLGGTWGIFSSEAGVGTSPIAAAAAKTEQSAEQGLISMTSVFIDTIICTLTGLSIILTGFWKAPNLQFFNMANAAFESSLGNFGETALMICFILFAFTTILGWNYYGERAVVFIFGTKSILPYRLIFIAWIAFNALSFIHPAAFGVIGNIINGLMIIPNLIALIMLSGVVVKETKSYSEQVKNSADEI